MIPSRAIGTMLILLSVLFLASALPLPFAHFQSVVTTVTVENGPVGVAYDSGKGEIFVTDFFNNTVSVISDENNTVIATVGVGNNPVGVAYDSGKGEVFVADSGSDTFSGSNIIYSNTVS